MKGEEGSRLRRGGIPRALFALETALLLATLALDLIGVLADAPAWYMAAKHVGGTGVVVGVVAFLVGLVGYLWGAPKRSLERRSTRRRILAGLAALVLFGVAYWVRGGPGVPPDPPILWVEGLGAICLGFATMPRRARAYRGRAGAGED